MKFIGVGHTEYIKAISVADCFASRDFAISVPQGKDRPQHLILTGRNGAGKTTILKGIATKLKLLKNGAASAFGGVIKSLDFEDTGFLLSAGAKAYFPATRLPNIKDVKSPTATEALEVVLNKDSKELGAELKQFLVNKKIAQAFSQIANRTEEVKSINDFFERILKEFRGLFSDDALEFEFLERSYDFDFVLGDGRRVKFNQLPDGFSAFIWILMDLLMRVDAIRAASNDFTIDPPGIVLIDEPELHLHLELQYKVLPILTTLFPNVQFIVATHSPAVISSIRNATVFDLTSKEIAPSSTPGAAFSELMQTHFGLENEFGPVADEILDEAMRIIRQGDKSKAAAELKKLLEKNADVLSPVLRLELESTLFDFEMKQS